MPRKQHKSKRHTRSKTASTMRFTRKLVFNQPKVTADTGSYSNPRLSDFTTADIVAMFQKYRINRLTYRFRLINAPNNNADFPTLNIAPVSYYSAVAPANRDEILQLTGGRSFQFGPTNIEFAISVVPKVARGALSTGVGYQISGPQWLDTVSTGVNHLAFGYWFTRYNSTSSSSHTIEVEITADVSVMGAR